MRTRSEADRGRPETKRTLRKLSSIRIRKNRSWGHAISTPRLPSAPRYSASHHFHAQSNYTERLRRRCYSYRLSWPPSFFSFLPPSVPCQHEERFPAKQQPTKLPDAPSTKGIVIRRHANAPSGRPPLSLLAATSLQRQPRLRR